VVTLPLSTGESERIHLVGPGRVRAGLAGIPDQDPVAFDALVAVAAARGYSEVLVLQQGSADEVWQYNDIVRSWARVSLVLDKRLARARKVQTAGGVMMGVGAAVAVTGAVIGLTSYDRGRDTAAAMTTADGQVSAGLYDLYVADYERYRSDTHTGWALLVAGGAVMSVGIPLLTHGAGQQRAAQDDRTAAVRFSPSVAGFTLSGRF
jgi:type V secretory pathway adhesin AidA